MRRGEITASGLLVLFSIYLMWKSTELPIGWIREYGPGGGAYPFWLSVGMLLSSGLIFVKALRRTTPESSSDAPFMSAAMKGQFFRVTGAIVVMVGLIHVVGVYVSLPLFLIYYLRFLGRHRWVTTIALSVAIPVVTFLFFEKLLLILLPKGITDELFYIFF